MREYEKKDFAKLLKRGNLEGHRWMRESDSTTVRIYDRNLEGIPVTVELYGPYARVVDYSKSDDSLDKDEVVDIVSRMVYVEKKNVIYQYRHKREGLEQHSATGEEATVLTVKENGLSFRVDLSSHIDSGLFLDNAGNREAVRQMAEGRKVLNLFSYTGAFSVYAASGLAESVVSVDLSNTYNRICRENLRDNGFLDEERYKVISSDALPFIKGEIEKGAKYDIIIFDPPSFSNSHKMDETFNVKRDYLKWFELLNKILSDHGLLVFCTNLGGFVMEKSRLKQAFRVQEVTHSVVSQGCTWHGAGSTRTWYLVKMADFHLVKRENKGYKRDGSRQFYSEERKRYNYDNDYKGKDMKAVTDKDFEALVVSMEYAPQEGEKKAEEGRRSYEKREDKRSYDRRSYDRNRRDDRRSYDRKRDFSDSRERDYRDRGYYRERDSRDRDYRDRNYRDSRERNYHDRDYRDRDYRDRDYRDRDYRDRDYRGRDYSARDSRDRDYRDRNYKDRDYKDRERSYTRERDAFRKKTSVRPYGFDNISKSRNRKDREEERD